MMFIMTEIRIEVFAARMRKEQNYHCLNLLKYIMAFFQISMNRLLHEKIIKIPYYSKVDDISLLKIFIIHGILLLSSRYFITENFL